MRRPLFTGLCSRALVFMDHLQVDIIITIIIIIIILSQFAPICDLIFSEPTVREQESGRDVVQWFHHLDLEVSPAPPCSSKQSALPAIQAHPPHHQDCLRYRPERRSVYRSRWPSQEGTKG